MSDKTPSRKSSGSWNTLPTLKFSRGPAPSPDAKSRMDAAFNVASPKTLGAEFENRKSALKGS